MTQARIPLPETDSKDLVARSALGHQPEHVELALGQP